MIANISKHSEEQTFKSYNFSNLDLTEYSFSDCTFENCDFTETILDGARLWECIFKRCNLSLASFKKSQLVDVNFEESKLTGIDFSRCDTSLLFSISASKSFFQYCNFSTLPMKRAVLEECKIHQSRFIDASLRKASFIRTDFSGTVFHNNDLTESNFEHAINYAINPCENKISKAKFSFPECIGLLKALEIIIVE